ncbi:MAG TPA: MMPL family transporter, partial [Kiloniellales bacterium]
MTHSATPPSPSWASRLLERWVRLVERIAALVLVLAVLATGGAATITVANIGINTSTTDMLSPELPFRRHDAAISRAFPQLSDTLIVVVESDTADGAADAAARLAGEMAARPKMFREIFYPEGDEFFRRNGLLYLDVDELQALSDRLAEAQPLLSALSEDPSLRGLAGVLDQALSADAQGNAARAAVAPVLDKMAATVESLIAARAGDGRAVPLSWRALLSDESPTAEARRRIIAVQPVLDFASLTPASAAIDTVRRLTADLDLAAAHGAHVRLSGSPILFQEELETLRDSIGLVGLISAFLVAGLLAMALRSARLVAACLVTLIMGLIWTACFATVAIGELNLISVAFAVLFIGLSVDFGIHYALRYREAVDDRGRKAGDALAAAAASVGGPLTLCAVTAAIGFFAFLPTDYRGVSELGLISGVGMFIALFANLTVLPAFLTLLPVWPGAPLPRNRAGEWLQHAVVAHRRPVIAAAVLLGLAAAAAVPFAWFDDDPLNLRDPRTESVSTLVDLLDDARVQPYRAEILASNLAEGKALAERLRTLPEVEEATTLADFVPVDQDDKLAVIDGMALYLTPVLMERAPAAELSPAQRAQAVEGLRRSLEAAPDDLRASATRFAAALGRLGSDDTAAMDLEHALLAHLPQRLNDLGEALQAGPVALGDLPAPIQARSLAADGHALVQVVPKGNLHDPDLRRRFVDAITRLAPEAAGPPITITEAGRAVVRAFAEAAVLAVLLIIVLLLVLLRSVRETALVLAPLLLAALLTVAATVVLRIPFNFANVIVLPLLFGLGVAGAIHIVTRAHGAGEALMATSTPRAVLFSALTTIGSFGALALSSHRGTASMGILLTIAICLSLICTLIVLPALLAMVPRSGGNGQRTSGGSMALRMTALIAGLGLLALVAGQADLADLWRRLVQLGAAGAVAVVLLFFLAFLVDTVSWQLMLPSARLDAGWLYRLWKVRMVGEALNLVIPAGSLGGEPVKAFLLKRFYGIVYRESGAS